MRSFKAIICSFGLAVAMALSVLSTPAQAQSGQYLPTANKIVYATNSVEIQDSTQKVAYVLKKGSFLVRTVGFSGGQAAIIESHSQRTVWRGPVSAVRIVGVANNDSLKVLSLKSTPF